MDHRALIVTYYFPPLGGGGVQRMAKLVKYASRLGWQFTVVTADEQTEIIARDETLLEDIPESVQIWRIPFSLLPAAGAHSRSFLRNAGFLKRYLSALFYLPDSRKKWINKAWPRIREELENGVYDLVLISIPPYSLSFLGSMIEEQFKIPVILDMRDFWSQYPFKIYPTPLHRWIDWRMERNVIQQTSWGISAYKGLIEYYRAKVPGFDERRWQVIPNGFDQQDFSELATFRTAKSTFDIAYSGTIYSHLNHPTPLFKAMALAKKINPQQGAKLRFVFVGKAHVDLRKLGRKYGLAGQLDLHPYLPHKESLRLLKNADAFCFILDDREKRSTNTIGGKVYEYLALRKPILALVPEQGEAADLINLTHSGRVISPRKIREIAKLLLQWSAGEKLDYSFTGIENYSRQIQAKKFVDFFERVLAARSASQSE